jgi:hypothetical protein
MLHFDWTITFGTLLSAAIVVLGTWATVSRLYSLLDKRLALFELGLGTHTHTLMAHAVRMERQDELMLQLAGDLREILGRMEPWKSERRRD